MSSENNILPPDFIFESEIRGLYDEYNKLLKNYKAAIREVNTKLENLDEDFELLHEHNPIHYIKSRLKSPESLIKKLKKKGLPLTPQAITENIYDVAGIRVICRYIDDIYTVMDLLKGQTDLSVVQVKDYIKNPKENGYRSLHIVMKVPVFFVEGVVELPVEIQIRTIAMDFWASLEHKLRYKSDGEIPKFIAQELKECADDISKNDIKMQKIHSFLDDLSSGKFTCEGADTAAECVSKNENTVIQP